jgi:hypothetical protein
MMGHFSRLIAAVTILLAGLPSLGQNRPKPSPSFSDSMGYMWESVEKDFISLADAMPEDKWDFKPTQGKFKDVRTFAEQVKHVACDNEAWAEKLRGEPPIPNCAKGGSNPARTKTELMAYLRKSFAMMDEGIKATNAANAMQQLKGGYAGGNRIEVITAALWHASDHYGQLVVYLRMNDIVPPASR